MIEIDYCASASSRRRIDFLYGRRPLATVSSSVAAGLSRPFHRAARPQTTKGGHLGRPTCAASPRRHVTRINPIGRDTHTHARTETHGRKPKAAIDTRNDADESPAAAAYDEKRRGRRRKKKRRSLQRRRPPARNPHTHTYTHTHRVLALTNDRRRRRPPFWLPIVSGPMSPRLAVACLSAPSLSLSPFHSSPFPSLFLFAAAVMPQPIN